MNLDEMSQAWRADPAPGPPDPELVASVRTRAEKLDRTLRRRDRRETVVAVAVSLIFLAAFPVSGLVTRIGILVTVAAAIFIVFMLRRARRGEGTLEPDAPVLVVLDQKRARVGAQIRLLRSVVWWYILPIGVGVMLVFGGGVGWGPLTMGYGAAVVVLGWVVHALNQKAVRTELVPRHEELDSLVRELEGRNDP
jgi:hypothetical protein